MDRIIALWLFVICPFTLLAQPTHDSFESLYEQGKTLFESRHFEEAHNVLDRALLIAEQQLNISRLQQLDVRDWQTLIAILQQDAAKANQLATIGIRNNLNPDGSPYSLHYAYRFSSLKAIIAEMHGNRLSAVEHTEEALMWLQKDNPGYTLEHAQLQLALARRLMDVQQYERSLSTIDDLFPKLETLIGAHDPQLRFLHYLRGSSLLAVDQPNQAAVSFLLAVEPFRDEVPLNLDVTEAIYQILGTHYRQRGQLDDAVHFWQLAEKLRAIHFGEFDAERAVYLQYIAAVHLERSEWVQAESFYLEARDIFLQSSEATHFWLFYIDSGLIAVYEAQNKPLLASKHRAEYAARLIKMSVPRVNNDVFGQ